MVLQPEGKKEPEVKKKESIFDKIIRLFFNIEER